MDPVTRMRYVLDGPVCPWSSDVERFLEEANRPGEGLKPERVTADQPNRWRGRLSDDEVDEINSILGRSPGGSSASPAQIELTDWSVRRMATTEIPTSPRGRLPDKRRERRRFLEDNALATGSTLIAGALGLALQALAGHALQPGQYGKAFAVYTFYQLVTRPSGRHSGASQAWQNTAGSARPAPREARRT